MSSCQHRLFVVDLINARSQHGEECDRETSYSGPCVQFLEFGNKRTLTFVVLTVWKQLRMSTAFSSVCLGANVNPRLLQGAVSGRELCSDRVCLTEREPLASQCCFVLSCSFLIWDFTTGYNFLKIGGLLIFLLWYIRTLKKISYHHYFIKGRIFC